MAERFELERELKELKEQGMKTNAQVNTVIAKLRELYEADMAAMDKKYRERLFSLIEEIGGELAINQAIEFHIDHEYEDMDDIDGVEINTYHFREGRDGQYYQEYIARATIKFNHPEGF